MNNANSIFKPASPLAAIMWTSVIAIAFFNGGSSALGQEFRLYPPVQETKKPPLPLVESRGSISTRELIDLFLVTCIKAFPDPDQVHKELTKAGFRGLIRRQLYGGLDAEQTLNTMTLTTKRVKAQFGFSFMTGGKWTYYKTCSLHAAVPTKKGLAEELAKEINKIEGATIFKKWSTEFQSGVGVRLPDDLGGHQFYASQLIHRVSADYTWQDHSVCRGLDACRHWGPVRVSINKEIDRY